MNIRNIDFSVYEALIFDLDGTLIDSMPIHNQAWIETLANYGCNLSVDMLMGMAGLSSIRTVEILNEKFKVKLDPVKITKEKENKYLARVHEVKIAHDLFSIVERFRSILPTAIVTGGGRDVVEVVLEKLKLDHLFDTITCAGDIPEGKDTPVPFHLTAKKLNVNPQKCLFFDDGDVGLKGAKMAGMKSIRVDLGPPIKFQHY